uniref:Phosphoglycerate kinase n=1 Tax=Lotharella globosa TaxID=91324 RepID=A0A7S3Z2R6_9EUKA|mmetsp:Transcript_24618/g.48102  ORF Transcript_24618/g.48102 Transcript_24618/m.48102 type:complete len:227 (-) Transcript_24618:178-858(-)
MEKELTFLHAAVESPKRPFAAVVGGAKVSTKIPVLESLMDKCEKLLVSGGMIFTFLKARGLSVGKSILEEDILELASDLEAKAKAKGVELLLPVDVVIADNFSNDANTQVVSVEDIPDGWMGLDHGPKTQQLFRDALSDCKTIVWNGPMGAFEMENFASGTYDLAECLGELTAKGAVTIVGGGDSVAAIKKKGLEDTLTHISTGGGASLEMLEGKELPGVTALDSA